MTSSSDPHASDPTAPTLLLGRPRPRGLSKRKLRFDYFTPRRAVQWLAPGQLARTGIRVAVAEGIGGYLDKREQQVGFPDDAFREDEGRSELWLDYVADTGDGFHATYAVAYSLGRDQLAVKGVSGPLPRGQVLVIGGDAVYPTPSQSDYDDRLRGPFQAALPEVRPGEARPTMYALPGNHDWYDGLTSFFRVFAGARTSIGAWTTRQKRSYFAVKLPANWWLFAVDAQEGSHIDDPQLEYFHKIVNESLQDGDRIILCMPEPAWVQGAQNGDVYRATDYFLRKVIEPAGQEAWLREAYRGQRMPAPKALTVPLMLSGDWHHYSRYERRDPGPDRRQLITCGGGGAYLSGTQFLPRRVVTPPVDMRPPKSQTAIAYERKARYPSAARSFWLGLGAPIRLPWRNPGFVAMLGAVQAVLWYLWGKAAGTVTGSVVTTTLIVLGSTLFLASGLAAPTKGRLKIVLFGLIHGIAQLFGVRAVMKPVVQWVGEPTLVRPTAGLSWDWARISEYGRYYLEWAGWYTAYGVVAGIVSAVIVGLYLVLASAFKVNLNELFSAQRIESHKCFVRLHIAPNGQLTGYVIGMRRVRRLLPAFRSWHWKVNPDAPGHEPWFTPRKKLRYHLVDTFTL